MCSIERPGRGEGSGVVRCSGQIIILLSLQRLRYWLSRTPPLPTHAFTLRDLGRIVVFLMAFLSAAVWACATGISSSLLVT